MSQAQNNIIRLLIERSGLLFNKEQHQKAVDFLTDRMHHRGIHSYDAYLQNLNSSQKADELARFIEAFAVGETSFFRNPNHWRAFRTYVLPDILKRKTGSQNQLRFWSAGCATGEEAYTLAICLWLDLDLPQQWDIQIVATNIDRKALAKARKGLYSRYSFRGVNVDTLEDHFDKSKDHYRIKKRYRQMVDFGELNLVSEEQYPENLGVFDVIFCRNVLMYFRPEPAQKAVQKIVDRLVDDGFLFLGHAEGNLASRDILTPIGCCDTFIYQKRKTEELVKKGDLPSPEMFPATLREKGKIKHSLKKTPRMPGVVHISEPRLEQKKPEPLKNDVETTPDSYRKALNYYICEDYDKALTILSQDNANEQKSLRELVLIGLIFFNRSDLYRAEDYRRQAHQISRTSPEVHALEAMIRAVQGDDQGAIKANRNAIFLDNNFFAPNFALGRLYEKLGDTEAAKRHFANALKILDTDEGDRVKLFYGIISRQALAAMCTRK